MCWQHGFYQPAHDCAPRHKPPVALFDLGMELELFGLHGLTATLRRNCGGPFPILTVASITSH
jgi:hypothetical protein